jgi:predicted transcriptional regulator
MNKGRLSQNERFLIQGAIHNKKTPAEIAELINRTEKCVENYINGELSKLQDTIVNVQLEQNPVKPVVKSTLPKGQAKLTMANKTQSGKSGVAVMTQATSEVGDEFTKSMPKTMSRTSRGNLYTSDGIKIE